MCGAPSIVPVVGCRALIARFSYAQWLLGPVRGLSIPHRARGVKASGFTFTSPLPPPLPFHLPPHHLDLLQHFLVGQQALSYQHPACSILLHHHRPEQFLEGDDLAWIEFFGIIKPS